MAKAIFFIIDFYQNLEYNRTGDTMKKIIKLILVTIMLIGNTYLLLHDLHNGKTDRIATYIALYPLLFVPSIFKKFIHLKSMPELEIIYYCFLFLAQFLGSGVNLYKYIDWFDTFTHLISGILTCFIALILLHLFGYNPKKKLIFNTTYILGIVFLVAGMWEFFEFGMDQFTGSNLQHWMETGVKDTMCDMLAAFCGSVIFLVAYLYEILTNDNSFITKFIDSI